ncbi:MAG: hypothetical protein LBJ67_05870 [Planctomycetaceae bacterium]|nr:hypothetical protein [Planctomycetaceae bacterium]
MNNEKNCLKSKSVTGALSKVFSRRTFLKLGIVSSLIALPALKFATSSRQQPSFCFGFDRLPEDPDWFNGRSFNDVLSRLPKSLSFFEPDSFFIFFPSYICLDFFTYGANPSQILMVEGKSILNNGNTIDGPVSCYTISPPEKPVRASCPIGLVTPLILPSPQTYIILFPPHFELSVLRRVEWSLSIIG